MNNTAKMTAGGLTKSKLKYNKRGRIVSKKASKLAKTNNRLVNAGYITKKGILVLLKKVVQINIVMLEKVVIIKNFIK